MTEPDEAKQYAQSRIHGAGRAAWMAVPIKDELAMAYRAGQAASAERIRALEGENAALQELAGTYQVRMSDMLTRLEKRYPEDFVWLKEADQ